MTYLWTLVFELRLEIHQLTPVSRNPLSTRGDEWVFIWKEAAQVSAEKECFEGEWRQLRDIFAQHVDSWKGHRKKGSRAAAG